MKICTAEKTALREVVGDGDVGDLESLTQDLARLEKDFKTNPPFKAEPEMALLFSFPGIKMLHHEIECPFFL